MINAQIINRKISLSDSLRKAISKIQTSYSSLAVNQKLYVNALLFLLLYSLFPKAINPDLDKGILSLFLIIWVTAMSCDLLTLYKKVYETLVGKAILLLVFTALTNVAISLSAQVVNDVTGVNPSSFPHTQAILAILMIPLLAVGIGGILYFGILILSPFIFMFHISDDELKRFIIPSYSISYKINFLKTTRIIQVVSIIVFFGLIYSLSQKISRNYSTFVSESARFFVYNMEMYSKAPCPIEGNGKIAFIGDDKILVGFKSKSETVFRLAECKTKL